MVKLVIRTLLFFFLMSIGAVLFCYFILMLLFAGG